MPKANSSSLPTVIFDAKGEFIVTSDGDMLSGEYAIDADKNVYEYDYELDALVKVPALAYNSEAMLLNYDADSQLCVNELIMPV